jgi:4-hydroxy 2-oxovalerate aldolase
MNNMDEKILFFDATLRDGSHAIKHQLSLEAVSAYCEQMDDAGVYTVIVGHGNGLGASSLQVGLSKHTDNELLTSAKSKLKKTKLGAYLIPGFGTIHDNIIPALEIGTQLFKIGCHCTEADTTKEHIEYLSKNAIETYGVLMMIHMAAPPVLLEEVKKMESYGARGVILMDSSGNLVPDDVKKRIELLSSNTSIRIGFHAHNNLGLSIANTLAALECGATIVDGTIRGFGAGAGNCQLEVLGGVLQRIGIETGLNLYRMMDVSENIVEKMIGYKEGISPLSLISGLSGVFSAFSVHVKRASEQFGVDPRDIFIELGRRKVVAGQEDIVVDVAMNLAQMKQNDNTSYMIESLL